MYNFQVTIGDFSDDGHCHKEFFVVQSNIRVEDVQGAFKSVILECGLGKYERPQYNDFLVFDVLREHEETHLDENHFKILNDLGLNNWSKYGEIDDNTLYICKARGFVNLVMDLSSLKLNNFEYSVKTGKCEEKFNGGEDLNVQLGYGIF